MHRLADPALLEYVRETGCWINGELNAMMARTGKVRAVRGMGFMWGIDTHEPAASIVARAYDRGLLLVGAGEHTRRLLPPLIMTREQPIDALTLLESVIVNSA